MNDEAKTILVCDDCAAGLCNDDWTHVDFYHSEEAEALMGRVAAFQEEHGYLTMVGPGESNGYYQCPCCCDEAIDGVLFTSEK